MVFEDVIGEDYCKYLYHTYICDTYEKVSEHHVHPLGDNLHLPKDWFDKDYHSRLDVIEKNCQNETNMKTMLDTMKSLEKTNIVKDVVACTTTVYDTIYYDTYINV